MVRLPTPVDDGMEFNRYTLTGEQDALYVALLRFVESDIDPADESSEQELLLRLKGHITRGVGNLTARLKSPADVARLAEAA